MIKLESTHKLSSLKTKQNSMWFQVDKNLVPKQYKCQLYYACHYMYSEISYGIEAMGLTWHSCKIRSHQSSDDKIKCLKVFV